MKTTPESFPHDKLLVAKNAIDIVGIVTSYLTRKGQDVGFNDLYLSAMVLQALRVRIVHSDYTEGFEYEMCQEISTWLDSINEVLCVRHSNEVTDLEQMMATISTET